MAKKLYRSTTDVIIAGVCGGLGKSLGIDPAFIRLFFVLGIWAGFSLLIYPALWLILPREDRADATTDDTIQTGAAEMAEQARTFGETVRSHSIRAGMGERSRHHGLAGILLGGLLILAGASALADSMHLHLSLLSSGLLAPLILIVIGFVLIQRRAATA